MMMDTKVLLADDHAILREGIRMVLDAQPGITVVGEAEDGRQALDMVESYSRCGRDGYRYAEHEWRRSDTPDQTSVPSNQRL